MKGEFTIEFTDEPTARKALKAFDGPTQATKRAAVKRSVNKNVLTIVITANDFTALRAMATSSMRDAKVFYDAVALTSRK